MKDGLVLRKVAYRQSHLGNVRFVTSVNYVGAGDRKRCTGANFTRNTAFIMSLTDQHIRDLQGFYGSGIVITERYFDVYGQAVSQ